MPRIDPIARASRHRGAADFDVGTPTVVTTGLTAAKSLSMARERDLARLLGAAKRSGGDDAGSSTHGASPLATRISSPVCAQPGDTDALDHAIETALQTRRSRGPEGIERLLTPAAHARLTAALATLPAAVTAKLCAQIATIGGGGADLGRAVYIKAVAARGRALSTGAPAEVKAALATLAAFARRLDGMTAPELRERSSVLDLNSTRDTLAFEPLTLELTRGRVHAPAGTPRGDNDGLFQRFTGTCGPTTIQMALCEEDPVRAFIVHDSGIDSAGATDVAARFQSELLAQYDSATISRRAHLNLSRLRNGLAQLRRGGRVSGADSDALRFFVEKGGPHNAGAKRAVAQLRELAAGFPTAAELGEMRADPQKGATGLDVDQFGTMLDAELGAVTGCHYRAIAEIAPGEGGPHLAAIERALRAGYDVPFGVVQAEHWMLISAVKGRGSQRQFLISDSYSARTIWVSQRSLISGAFVARDFDLLDKGARDHIDTFYIPEPVAVVANRP